MDVSTYTFPKWVKKDKKCCTTVFKKKIIPQKEKVSKIISNQIRLLLKFMKNIEFVFQIINFCLFLRFVVKSHHSIVMCCHSQNVKWKCMIQKLKYRTGFTSLFLFTNVWSHMKISYTRKRNQFVPKDLNKFAILSGRYQNQEKR